ILKSVQGGEIRFSEMQGRWVVIDFWTTWSGASAKMLPVLEEIRKQFGNQDLIFLSVNVQESRGVVEDFLGKHKLSAQVALDPDGTFADKLQVTVLPQVVLVEPSGKVHSGFSGVGRAMTGKITEVLEQRISGDSGGSEQENAAGVQTE
ncbi:MAG: TlpA disulfide reductase family protein, partial [Planctomycetota bacterium]|nr:TlpA disulfide reductase family protein [Planctomycetota bacterium]